MTPEQEETALRIANEQSILWEEGCGHENGILKFEALEYAERLRKAWEKELKAQEPVAWDVMVHEKQQCYLVNDIDDPQLVDDCTNHGAIVTPLFTRPSMPAVPAKTRYDELTQGDNEPDPIERLLFYLSLALKGQDWLDVEKFIDDLNAPAVSEGYRIVPIEPTEEMIEAYLNVSGVFSSARSDWKAMLAAAKEPK